MEWKECQKARCRTCGMEVNFVSKNDLTEHLKECPLDSVEKAFEILTLVKV